MSQVEIFADESAKTITVKIPDAKILSNELFEESMSIYVEEDSIFSKITLDDSCSIRSEIKEKAKQNAINNNLLVQAHKKAEEMITYLIESVPAAKDNYTIILL